MWDKPKPAQLYLRWGLTHQLFLTNSHHSGMIPQLRPAGQDGQKKATGDPHIAAVQQDPFWSEVLNILK